jgi:hypothetical protein
VCAVSLFAQPRGSTTRKEHAAFRWTKTTVEGRKKGFALNTKLDFFELLTKPRMKATLPCLGKKGPWRWPLDLTCLVCPVPNTYIEMQSCIPTMIWWWCGGSATSYPDEVLGSTPKTWLNGLASSHVLHLALSGTPKLLLYCTEYRWPTTLAPTNEESWAQWGKYLVGKK